MPDDLHQKLTSEAYNGSLNLAAFRRICRGDHDVQNVRRFGLDLIGILRQARSRARSGDIAN
jgi:hypothetical protein